MHVICTAGHVDHGKSSLVLALTGTDTDRFAEEKERGLTIDLGFASMELPSGRQVSFIDVPGHERFLKNMLAGVGGVNACLFVVAATEGWKPQSEEHLRILDLLGVGRGLVVLTKAGLADAETLEIARLDVADQVAGTFLEGAAMVAVDSLDGTGLEELAGALDELLGETAPSPDVGRPRLWIDRAFTIKGAGAVVTGTLLGGGLAVDDKLELVSGSAEVGGAQLRIRGIQNHGAAAGAARPGSRVALNLVGVAAAELERGDVLVSPGRWGRCEVFDASLSVLEALDHGVSKRGAYAAYLGSGEFPVQVRVLGAAEIVPGETGAVRVFLPFGLPLLPGDYFILRESGRAETAGGGVILDVAPVLAAAKAQPLGVVGGGELDGAGSASIGAPIDEAGRFDAAANTRRIICERGWVAADQLALLVGDAQAAEFADWQVKDWVVWPQQLEQTRSELNQQLEAGQLDWATLSDQQRAALDGMEGIEIESGLVRLSGQADDLASHPYLLELRGALFRPPAPAGIDRNDLRAMANRGLVLEASGVYFATEAVAESIDTIAELLRRQPEGFTVATLREQLDTSRKYIMPLLEIIDREGVVRRQDDLRTAGARFDEAREKFRRLVERS